MIDKKRLDELFEMGLHFNGQSYQGWFGNKELYVDFHHTDILCDTDKQWAKKMKSAKEAIKRYS